jgi:hypothetical protein
MWQLKRMQSTVDGNILNDNSLIAIIEIHAINLNKCETAPFWLQVQMSPPRLPPR